MSRKRYTAGPAPADSPGKRVGVPRTAGPPPAAGTGGRKGGSRLLACFLPVFSGEPPGCS